jgi:hypothetical protein
MINTFLIKERSKWHVDVNVAVDEDDEDDDLDKKILIISFYRSFVGSLIGWA